MNLKWLIAPSAALLVLHIPWSAQAFECPKHFAVAQAAIDKVAGGLKADIPWKRTEDKALVQALLNDAKMLLAEGKENHETAQRAFDHARAIAKANAALGYARAADIYHYRLLAE